MKMKVLNVDCFATLCRICLETEMDMKLLSDTIPEAEQTLNEIVYSCTSVQMNVDDGLPKNLCKKCLEKIVGWLNFKKLCVNSNDILRDLFNQSLKPVTTTTSTQTHEEHAKTDTFDKCEMNKDTNKFTCDDCGKNFSSRSTLFRHRRSHRSSKDFMCAHCGRLFTRNDYLVRHLRSHNGQKPHECHVCAKKFVQKFQMTEHVRAHLNQRQFQCHVCAKTFNRHLSRAKHMKTHASTLACKQCGQTFKNSRTLKSHEKRHAKESRTTCPECNRTFANGEKLAAHVQTHIDNPFVCVECKQAFACMSILQVHMRKHMNIARPHLCNICGKGHETLRQLKRHGRAHQGEKPFKCELCPRGYILSQNLARHQLTHLNEADTALECTLCNVIFEKLTDLTEHFDRCHAFDADPVDLLL